MTSPADILVDGPTARQLLSPKGDPGAPMGRTRFAAIKRAMGITSRHVSVKAMAHFLKENPNFSESQIYERKAVAARTGTLGVGAVLELRHGRWVFPFRVDEMDSNGKPQRLSQIEA